MLPDGTLASGACDGIIKIWNLSTYQTIRNLTASNGCVLSLAVLSDNILVAGYNQPGKIFFWDFTTGQIVRNFTGQRDAIKSLAVLPNNALASCSQDYSIRIWDLNSGSFRVLPGPHWCYSLYLLPGTNTLTATYGNGKVRLWNITDGTYRDMKNGFVKDGSFGNMVLLPDGTLAVCSGERDSLVRIFDINTGNTVRDLTEPTRAVTALVLLPDNTLAVGNMDSTFRIYNTTSGVLLKQWRTSSVYIFGLVLLPDYTLASAHADPTNVINIWN